MAFCKACGQDIGTANFCPKCGANQMAAVAPAVTPAGTAGAAAGAAAFPTESIQENVAGLLCYLPGAGWIIAIAFFLIDKRRFVKFHAVPALGVCVGMIALYMVLGMGMFLMHAINIFFIGMLLYPLRGLGCFVLLLFLMYKAYLNGSSYRRFRHGHRFQVMALLVLESAWQPGGRTFRSDICAWATIRI